MKPAPVRSYRYPGISTQPPSAGSYPSLCFRCNTHFMCQKVSKTEAALGSAQIPETVVEHSHLLLFETAKLSSSAILKASSSCCLPQRNISMVANVSTQLAAALHPRSYCSSQHFSSGSAELPSSLSHQHCSLVQAQEPKLRSDDMAASLPRSMPQ